MTPMTEKERSYFFTMLFPPLWPLALAMALCDLGEAVKGMWRKHSPQDQS